MRTAWKHGVVGVDDADSATTSIFYLEAEKQRQKELAEKEFINKRRQKGKEHLTFFDISDSDKTRNGNVRPDASRPRGLEAVQHFAQRRQT